MFTLENSSSELVFICMVLYLLLAATVARLGSGKVSGTAKVFLCSIFLTPVIGFAYAIGSPQKNVLKIIHYKCPRCGLEHTSKHKFCPTCSKEGKQKRLRKITMQTY